MKIWAGFGSEHSANLVMIGRFKEAVEAKQVKEIIDRLTEQAMDEDEMPSFDAAFRHRRYSEPMLKLLTELRINTVGPTELEQLRYDINHEVENNAIIFKTDELDISAFVKILIEKGARIEIYSAHDYPDTEKEQEGLS
jgi:hypothetical protein